MNMTPIETIHAIVASGITATADIAEELTRRGVPPPTTDGWIGSKGSAGVGFTQDLSMDKYGG
jgi:hypothetical protein